MTKNIHKKSLRYTLHENKRKVKSVTKKLIGMSVFLSIFFIAISMIHLSKIYVIGGILFISYSCYLCYTLFTLWQRNKNIKTKLKTL